MEMLSFIKIRYVFQEKDLRILDFEKLSLCAVKTGEVLHPRLIRGENFLNLEGTEGGFEVEVEVEAKVQV